jgi:hypothetical protein
MLTPVFAATRPMIPSLVDASCAIVGENPARWQMEKK